MRFLGPTSNARLNEACAVVFLAIGLFLLVSLVSYQPFDPSLNGTVNTVQPLADGSVFLGGDFSSVQVGGAFLIGGSFSPVVWNAPMMLLVALASSLWTLVNELPVAPPVSSRIQPAMAPASSP